MEETFLSLGAEDDFTAVARGDVLLIDEVTGEDVISRAQKYSRRLGVGQPTAGTGHAFVNGRYFKISDVSDTSSRSSASQSSSDLQNVFQQMANEVTAQLQILQEMACVTYSDRRPIADAP